MLDITALTLCADACRRFYLEIEGKQRFKVLECWEQDGYRVARPQYFADSPLPSASDAQANLASMCQSVDRLANIWLDKVRWVLQLASWCILERYIGKGLWCAAACLADGCCCCWLARVRVRVGVCPQMHICKCIYCFCFYLAGLSFLGSFGQTRCICSCCPGRHKPK